MKNLLKFPVIIIFTLAIIILTVLDFAKPDVKFSDMENRVLQSNPEFSFESLIAKDNKQKYTTKYEKYINDQFIARNSWISIKSFAETALGKQENNGIIYGEDGYMFERFDTIDEERLNKNIGFVKEYAEKNNLPMTFCIIPNSYMVLKDKFPSGAIAIDQKEYTDKIFKEIKSDNLTTEYIGPMEHPNEYVYYRTDHHWTTLGAYYGYEQLMKSKGMTAVPIEDLKQYEKTIEPFYGTYFSKAKKPNVISDTITYYDIPIKQVIINDEVKDGLYDQEQFKKRDAYAGFLYGNNGVTIIKSDNNSEHQEGKTSKILVIKDSYANSFVPYLTYNYDEIYVVDLRHLAPKMSLFMQENTFDEVLIMYNFKNFSTDTNLAKLIF